VARTLDFAAFKLSLAGAKPPAELGLPLQALWWEAKGNWDKAHECAQKVEDEANGQWVHAYLHRKQGDLDNAGYWYRQVGKPVPVVTLAREWQAIARSLLEDAGG
jgi:hypothetical protein